MGWEKPAEWPWSWWEKWMVKPTSCVNTTDADDKQPSNESESDDELHVDHNLSETDILA